MRVALLRVRALLIITTIFSFMAIIGEPLQGTSTVASGIPPFHEDSGLVLARDIITEADLVEDGWRFLDFVNSDGYCLRDPFYFTSAANFLHAVSFAVLEVDVTIGDYPSPYQPDMNFSTGTGSTATRDLVGPPLGQEGRWGARWYVMEQRGGGPLRPNVDPNALTGQRFFVTFQVGEIHVLMSLGGPVGTGSLEDLIPLAQLAGSRLASSEARHFNLEALETCL